MELLHPGRYCGFVVDLGNYGRNSVTPSVIFDELRRNNNDQFTFTGYHRRRSGNFVLEVKLATPVATVEKVVSDAINQAANHTLNKDFRVIFRTLSLLKSMVLYARNNLGLQPNSSDVVQNRKKFKIVAVFAGRGLLEAKENLPLRVSSRVVIIADFHDISSSFLTLYDRPIEGGDMGEPAVKLRNFLRKSSGYHLICTGRAISVIDDIVLGKVKS